MPYIIDGNNVMAVFHRDKITARKMLMTALVKFKAVHRTKIKVVFDGVPDDQYPDGIVKRGINVLYARPGSDADTKIKSIVNKASFKRDIIVVSSDKELVSYVRHRGTKSLSSHKFKDELLATEQRFLLQDKIGQSSVDVKDWLDYFGESHKQDF